jgi:hypothetical protein
MFELHLVIDYEDGSLIYLANLLLLAGIIDTIFSENVTIITFLRHRWPMSKKNLATLHHCASPDIS